MEKMLKELNFNKLTPIQEAVIKQFNSPKNLVGIAPTGTGKTHAYLLPLVNSLNPELKQLQAIILIPTNELVMQVRAMLKPLDNNFSVKAYHFKTNKQREEEWLTKNQPNIVISTPERLIEMRNLGLNLNHVKHLILDEADMMFDEDFLTLIDKIIASLRTTKFSLFSASINENMYTFIKKYFGNYDLIDTTSAHELKIVHKLVKVNEQDRYQTLEKITKIIDPYLALIFVSKKEEQEEVFLKLYEQGLNVTLLSSKLTQHKRKIVINEIHNLKYQYVVASDLAARGIDFDASLVINYNLPYQLEFFKHRSGRTGRMDKTGEVITLATNDERHKITRLKEMGFNLEEYRLTTTELVKISKKQKPLTKKEVEAIKAIPKPKKVKPNYKKKNKKKIKEAKNKVRGRENVKNR